MEKQVEIKPVKSLRVQLCIFWPIHVSQSGIFPSAVKFKPMKGLWNEIEKPLWRSAW